MLTVEQAKDNHMQIDIFSGKPEVKWLQISRLPSMQWLLDNAGQAFRDLRSLTDDKLIDAWKAGHIANYAVRFNKEPAGFKWSQRHILPQIGSRSVVDKLDAEMTRRGLRDQFGVDIELHT